MGNTNLQPAAYFLYDFGDELAGQCSRRFVQHSPMSQHLKYCDSEKSQAKNAPGNDFFGTYRHPNLALPSNLQKNKGEQQKGKESHANPPRIPLILRAKEHVDGSRISFCPPGRDGVAEDLPTVLMCAMRSIESTTRLDPPQAREQLRSRDLAYWSRPQPGEDRVVVEPVGIEPTTSSMPWKRSPS
jgi:hypothetical protein